MVKGTDQGCQGSLLLNYANFSNSLRIIIVNWPSLNIFILFALGW